VARVIRCWCNRDVTPTIRSITWNRSKIRDMKAFHTGREAKEFLFSKILEEAQRENVPLSDVERKTLYFTGIAARRSTLVPRNRG
jgi:hypothetical protein